LGTRYFTGKPCKRGHIAERLVSNRCCVVCGREKVVRYRARNTEKVREWNERASRRRAGSEKKLATQRRYRQKNRGKILAAVRARQFFVKQATPAWADKKEIQAIYEIAAEISKDNIKWSVDHIVPLRGVGVCGLHVPWNLMLMPLDTNIRKGRGSVSDLETRCSVQVLLNEPG
jgi:hypothetical protein